MSNVLDHTTQQQVLALGRLGWTLSRIQATTGVRRETISGYLKAAGIPVRRRGRPSESTAKPAISPPEVSTDPGPSKPAISGEVSTDSGLPKPATRAEVSTDSGAIPRPGRAPSASACEPYRELIVEALGRGRNAMAIWQDLVDRYGFSARYASVRRFVRALRGTTPAEARVVITTVPGEEAQVDYGDGPMVRHPKTGKYRRARLFVLTLGYSRKSIRLLVWHSSAQTWAELHERAFRRLGGTTRVVVLDNLKEGVLTPDIYDPALNPLYRDVLTYYGVVGLPCRVGDPDRKGKVESGVGHTQKTPLQGLRFETIDEAQTYLDRWDTRWADTRIHGTTKRQVAAMFAEEQPALGPLPLEPFRTASASAPCTLMAAWKSTPRTTARRPDGSGAASMCNGMICTSASSIPRPVSCYVSTSEDVDRPTRTPPKTLALLTAAHRVGRSLGAIADHIHQHDGAAGVRRILGLLALAKKHGPAVVEDAAKAALDLGVPTYRFVRRYLDRRPPVPLTLRQVDPLIRQLTLYRDLIDRTTGDPS